MLKRTNQLTEIKIDKQKHEIQHKILDNLSTVNHSSGSLHQISPQQSLHGSTSHSPRVTPNTRGLRIPYNKGHPLIHHGLISDPPWPIPLTLLPIAIDSDPLPTVSAKMASFWVKNVTSLSIELQLEIGWSVYIGLLCSNSEIRKVFRLKSIKQIESTSLKFLDMIGYLIRAMRRNQPNSEFLHKSLQKLGSLHSNMGVKLEHYAVMLQQLHDTFGIYFGDKYNKQIRLSVHRIFVSCVKLMTGGQMQFEFEGDDYGSVDASSQCSSPDTSFLYSLDVCLQSDSGRQKLFRYLKQKQCNEMVIFLHLMLKFRSAHGQARYMTARYIMKRYIVQLRQNVCVYMLGLGSVRCILIFHYTE